MDYKTIHHDEFFCKTNKSEISGKILFYKRFSAESSLYKKNESKTLELYHFVSP